MRGELGDRSGEAGSLGNLATVSQIERDFDAARSQFERTLAIHEELGNRNGVAVSLTCLGTVSHDQGDFDSAREFLSRAISLNREIGDAAAEANAINNLGSLEREVGNLQSARIAFEQALKINRDLGYEWEASLNLTNLGNCALDDGDLVTAGTYLTESLKLLGKVGARRFIAAGLEAWARLEVLADRTIRSARLCGAAASLLDAVGVPRPDREMHEVEQVIASVRGALGDKQFEEEFATGRVMAPDQAIEYALSRDSG